MRPVVPDLRDNWALSYPANISKYLTLMKTLIKKSLKFLLAIGLTLAITLSIVVIFGEPEPGMGLGVCVGEKVLAGGVFYLCCKILCAVFPSVLDGMDNNV